MSRFESWLPSNGISCPRHRWSSDDVDVDQAVEPDEVVADRIVVGTQARASENVR